MVGHVFPHADTGWQWMLVLNYKLPLYSEADSYGLFTCGPSSVTKTPQVQSLNAQRTMWARKTQFPILSRSSQKASISQESPLGQGGWAERLHNKAIFVRRPSPVWITLLANFELNVTKFRWMVELNTFQPPVPLEKNEFNTKMPQSEE